MTIPECTFILPNGRKCRCAASRNQTLCRHHGPAVAGPPPTPKSELYSSLRRWRQLGRELPNMPAEEIPFTIYGILQCLVDRGPDSAGSISDLAAGRFLRALLNRLGDVPFPYPDSPSSSEPALEPDAPPTSAGQPDLSAMLAALGLPSLGLPSPGLPPRNSPLPSPRVQPSGSRVRQ
ncbi:MAG TPA: hypothetical protein VIY53_05700 [Acidobacteriaceae bacterium]